PDAESEVTHDPEGGLIRQVISDEDAERRLPGQGQEPESSRAGVVTPCAKFDSTIDPFDDDFTLGGKVEPPDQHAVFEVSCPELGQAARVQHDGGALSLQVIAPASLPRQTFGLVEDGLEAGTQRVTNQGSTGHPVLPSAFTHVNGRLKIEQ